MGNKAKVYYETSVKTPVIWYNGTYSGSLVHNGTTYVYSNCSLSSPDYRLSLEKIPTVAQASTIWCIRGTVPISGSSTMYLQVGYARGDVSPISTEDEAPGTMSGVTIGFASDMWATSMTIEVYLVQPEDMFTVTNPETVYINNVENTEPFFSYNFLENDNIVNYYNQGYVVKGVKIFLNNWSSVTNPIITYVAPYLVQTYEKERGLLGFKTGYQSLPDNNEPYFGIVAGYGELKLFDKNDNIFKLANLDMLRQRQTVKLFVDDVVIGTYVTESWNYNTQTKEVSISLEDDFIDLQETSVEAINLIEPKNSYNLYNLIATNVFGDTSTFLPFKYSLQTTISVTGTTIGSFYLNKATTWQTLNKICQFFGVCLFKTGQEQVNSFGGYARRQKVVLGMPDWINGGIYEVTPDKIISESVTTNLTNKNYIEGVSYDRYMLETSSGETLATIPIFKTKTGAQASATNTVYNYSFLNTLLEYVPNTSEEYDYGLPNINLAYGSSDWQGNTHEFLGELTSVSTNWTKTMLVDGQSIVVPSNVLIKKDLYDAGNVKISWPVFEIPLYYNGSSYYFRAQDIRHAKKTGALGANLGNISYTAEEVSGTIGEEELSLSFDVPNWDYYYNVDDAPNNIPVVKVNYVSTKNTTTPAYPDNRALSVHFVPYLTVSYEGATFKEVVTPAQIGATKNIYTLETNELMNEETTTTSGKLVDIRAQAVLTKYKNGKKTAKLSCLYGTPYYTPSGRLSNYQLLANPHFDSVTGWTSTATSPITATQRVSNPNFSVSTGWTAKPSTTMTINTTLKHLSFNGYGASTTFGADENEPYYFAALVKSPSAAVKLLGISAADAAYHTGSNEYELLSILTTSTTTTLRTLSIESSTVTNDCFVKYVYGYKLSDLKTNNPYSPMFETTFNNLTNYQIKLQMNAWFQEGIMPSGYSVFSNSAFVVRTIGTPLSITQTATLPTARIYYALEMRTSSAPIEFKMGSLTRTITGTGFESGIFTNTNSNPVSITMLTSPTGLREVVVEFVYAINVTNLINNKVYSPMFGTTFDLLQDDQIKAQLDYWVSGTSMFSEILVNQEVKDDATGWSSDVSSLSWTDNTIFPLTTTNRYVLDIYQSKQVKRSGEYYFAAKAKATTNATSLAAASFYNPQPNQIKATIAYQRNPHDNFFYELSAIYSVSWGADYNQLFKVYSNDPTPSRTLHLDWFRAYDLSKLRYVYSPLFSTAFANLTTAQKKQQMDFWMQSGYLEEALSLAEVPLKEAVGAIGAYGNVFVPGMGVTPYIVKNGVNAPLATYKDGTPITYVVTGAEFEYDGSSKMNLELLERTYL